MRSDPILNGPDMQLLFMHAPYHLPHLESPPNSFTIGVTTTPKSRGSVRLRDASPDTPPIVDPRYLTDETDVHRLIAGVRHAREIVASHPLDGWRGMAVLPGENATSTEDLDAFVRNGTGTYHHPVGTCAIGQDGLAVVTPDLQVRGIEHLRIADASVIPALGCVNTNATAFMIAEKAADIINQAR
jgi:choline dehydrogenase